MRWRCRYPASGASRIRSAGWATWPVACCAHRAHRRSPSPTIHCGCCAPHGSSRRWAAVLHDIGKPATRRFEPDGRVTFHHHEAVGARMARARLKELRYSKDLVDDVAQLVFLHLRFYGYGRGEWTDSAVRRYVVDA